MEVKIRDDPSLFSSSIRNRKGCLNRKGAIRGGHFTAHRSMLCSVYRPEQRVYKPVPKRKGRRFHFVYYYYLFITSTRHTEVTGGSENILYSFIRLWKDLLESYCDSENGILTFNKRSAKNLYLRAHVYLYLHPLSIRRTTQK